jgi:acyl-CoA reductase-like NAD-dependent aldehyde dehydrogenase
MSAEELWVEAYQGEVLGEALFGLLAAREVDETRRAQLETLTLLERATKELAEPVFDRRGLDRGDTDATVTSANGLADTVAAMPWEQFVSSLEPGTAEYLAKYRQLAELATDDTERAIAETYVAHERALASFARRVLGQEDGAPLEPILALPHVAAKASAA